MWDAWCFGEMKGLAYQGLMMNGNGTAGLVFPHKGGICGAVWPRDLSGH